MSNKYIIDTADKNRQKAKTLNTVDLSFFNGTIYTGNDRLQIFITNL